MFGQQFQIMLLGVAFTMVLGMSQAAVSAGETIAIKLWEGVAPGSEKFTGQEVIEERGDAKLSNTWVTGVSEPTLTINVPPGQHRTGTGIVICPGGGYGGLALEKEGVEVARWLAELGITTFVLKYRHGGGVHRHPVPLSDIQRAVRLVRSQAAQWGVEPDKLGVLGFSAGGHLASSVGTHFDAGDKKATDPVEQQSCRPDFLMLIYPVISMDASITHGGSLENLLGKTPDPNLVELMSNDLQVTDQTPPTFIAHAGDDEAVPVENALRFYRALVAHKVPAELHVFAEGGHGFGMRQPGPVEEWPTLLANWLKSRKLVN
ncbi:MAG: alpha/beta hydrolase [Bythopirellula sp.]|nr:alpha/beta hydrolase [Bythopirellula sp.]